jgi:hypothetical protein
MSTSRKGNICKICSETLMKYFDTAAKVLGGSKLKGILGFMFPP